MTHQRCADEDEVDTHKGPFVLCCVIQTVSYNARLCSSVRRGVAARYWVSVLG